MPLSIPAAHRHPPASNSPLDGRLRYVLIEAGGVPRRRARARSRRGRRARRGCAPARRPPNARCRTATCRSRDATSRSGVEWTTHIQYGLTLLGQARGVPLSTYAPIPADVAARSASVANWITDQVVPGFSYKWPQPPASTSDERWVREIAKAYRGASEISGHHFCG